MWWLIPLLIILISILIKITYVVNQDEEMVCEYMGKFTRIRKSGLYFACPFEKFRSVKWKFRHAEEDTLQELNTARIPVCTLRYDPCALNCETKDGFRIKVDLVVNFRIEDVKKAVYAISNVFSELEDKLETYVYGVIRDLKLSQIKIEILRQLVSVEEINGDLMPMGICVLNIRVQEITLPEALVNATVQNEHQRLRNEAEIHRLEAERQHNLRLVESKALEQTARNQMESDMAEHRHQLRLSDAETELKVQKMCNEAEFERWDRITKTPGILQLLITQEQAKAAAKLGQSGEGKKLIIFADNAVTRNLGMLPVVKELITSE